MRNGHDAKGDKMSATFFERRARAPSALNMWTCFDGKDGRDHQQGEQATQDPERSDTRGFVPVNSKAGKNSNKASLAYIIGSRMPS